MELKKGERVRCIDGLFDARKDVPEALLPKEGREYTVRRRFYDADGACRVSLDEIKDPSSDDPEKPSFGVHRFKRVL